MVLHHVAHGTGPTALVIHGGPGLDHTCLRGFDKLGLPLRLVYLDLPGHGRSPPIDPAEFGPDLWAREIEALRAHLGEEKVFLVAHSFGPNVALAYALAHPDHVAGMILVATGFAFEHEETHANAMRKNPALARRFFGGFDGTNEGFKRWLADVAPLYFHRYDPAVVIPMFESMTYKADLLAAGGWGGDALERAVRALEIPTLVISGRHDFILPPNKGERVAKALGGEFHIIEESGHFPWEETPLEFRAIVARWLARTEPVEASRR